MEQSKHADHAKQPGGNGKRRGRTRLLNVYCKQGGGGQGEGGGDISSGFQISKVYNARPFRNPPRNGLQAHARVSAPAALRCFKPSRNNAMAGR